MRLMVLIAGALLVLLCSGVQAASKLDAGTRKDLVRLEQKFLGHSYDGDSDDGRAQRLEKLVFGEASTGDPEQRIKKLAAATAASSASEGANQSDRAATQVPQARVPDVSNYIPVDGKPAPVPVPTSAPGTESASVSAPQSGSVPESDPGTAPAVGTADSYPRVTALEKAILGKTFVVQPLPARLTRMESKAFGKNSTNPDLAERTEALEKYVAKTLHKKPADEENRRAAANAGAKQGSGLPAQVLSMVGGGLLSMAGLGPLGAVVPALIGVAGPHKPAGQPGAQPASNQPTQPAGTHPDEPAMYEPSPPQPGSRMLTRVGWCEVQVFGHTSPQMHLPERLGQLNRALNFAPGKPDVQLMDDVPALIKAVQAHKRAGN